jgi:hypothetical protein
MAPLSHALASNDVMQCKMWAVYSGMAFMGKVAFYGISTACSLRGVFVIVLIHDGTMVASPKDAIL